MSLVFSLPQGLKVCRIADRSITWEGHYEGMPIKFAVPSDDGERCVLLLDPDANRLPIFKNLLCVDLQGVPVWTAALPTSPDVFLEVTLSADGIWARTWSGLNILFDRHTGRELKRLFSK